MRQATLAITGLLIAVAPRALPAQGAQLRNSDFQPVTVVLADATGGAPSIELVRRKSGLPRNVLIIRDVEDTLGAFAVGMSFMKRLNRQGRAFEGNEQHIGISSFTSVTVVPERRARLRSLLTRLQAVPVADVPGAGRGKAFSIDDRF